MSKKTLKKHEKSQSRKKPMTQQEKLARQSEFYFYDCRVPFGFYPSGIWMNY